ncbi:MAG: GNAT family N-acetyltransferase [Bacteroidia bacterium]
MKPPIQLEPLDRFNWDQVLNVSLKPEQLAFVPSILYSIAQSAFEKQDAYGVRLEDIMVGLILVGKTGSMSWISRIYIDAEYQGLGIGTEAVEQLISALTLRNSEIRTSHAKANVAAAAFFEKLGFQPLSNMGDDEVVLVLER